MKRPLHVVVVGAGIGGLGAALAFARSGHHVTLVERDDTPMPADIEGAFEWDRRGAPQVRHPHAFLGLGRTILRDRFPDVLQALAAEGVQEVGTNAGALFDRLPDDVRTVMAADDDLKILPCRRTTLEWVLRRCVLADRHVELRVGLGVAGLVAAPVRGDGDVPTITGVRLEDGSTIDADLVVASTGRRSALPAWLAALGVAVRETSNDAGVVYFSRFYRSELYTEFGFRAGFGGGIACGVIGADARTYSVTAVVDKHDRELRTHLGDHDRFEATIRLMPELADVVAISGEPIHPVHCMTGLINRIYRYTDRGGNPLVAGVLAVGDAHTCTNPAYGRGQSLALLQATLAAEAVADSDDLVSAARRYEAACAERVEPWYHFSVLADRSRPQGVAGLTSGAGSSGPDLFGAVAEMSANPDLIHTLLRVINLLEPPQALFARLPELQQAAAAGTAGRAATDPDRPRRHRVSREEILAVA